MKRSRKIMVIAVTVLLTLASATGAAFADIDYSQWNTNAAYPSDIINTPLFPSVKFLIDKKIMTGYEDGTFRPANTITRAEIAVAVAKATNRTKNLDTLAAKDTFTDLTGYGWAKGYINALVDAGIVKGISATSFAPGKNISYAELVTYLVRMNQSAASELENNGTWPNNYIQYVEMYNLLGDVSVTDWNAPATRGDAAKLMYRILPKN
jgi:hypothetical protein